ncbi:MAG: hypothetical protein IPK04_08010 [Bdellovibrionales bacterium]|nr:hypothetical protein [Bdellovibrionales bacterium]MBL7671724.1 hypothetical protein [Pseudobdellovibrionaceae bacterium]
MIFAIALIWVPLVFAADPPKAQVLDFEGEVIEGESIRPDLFLQILTPDVNLDSIVYLRKDFNDFQRFDRNQKPRYLPEKK